MHHSLIRYYLDHIIYLSIYHIDFFTKYTHSKDKGRDYENVLATTCFDYEILNAWTIAIEVVGESFVTESIYHD